tara:strand:- start:489 stop:1343 length:855 start_codon:yes stop_codon:yes gene_type:complete
MGQVRIYEIWQTVFKKTPKVLTFLIVFVFIVLSIVDRYSFCYYLKEAKEYTKTFPVPDLIDYILKHAKCEKEINNRDEDIKAQKLARNKNTNRSKFLARYALDKKQIEHFYAERSEQLSIESFKLHAPLERQIEYDLQNMNFAFSEKKMDMEKIKNVVDDAKQTMYRVITYDQSVLFSDPGELVAHSLSDVKIGTKLRCACRKYLQNSTIDGKIEPGDMGEVIQVGVEVEKNRKDLYKHVDEEEDLEESTLAYEINWQKFGRGYFTSMLMYSAMDNMCWRIESE